MLIRKIVSVVRNINLVMSYEYVIVIKRKKLKQKIFNSITILCSASLVFSVPYKKLKLCPC